MILTEGMLVDDFRVDSGVGVGVDEDQAANNPPLTPSLPATHRPIYTHEQIISMPKSETDATVAELWARRFQRAIKIASCQSPRKHETRLLAKAVGAGSALLSDSPLLKLVHIYHAACSKQFEVWEDPFRRLLNTINTPWHTLQVRALVADCDPMLDLDLACGMCYVLCEDIWNSAKSVSLSIRKSA